MTDSLYFLGMLVEALEQRGAKRSLQAAFAKIQEMGSQAPYHQGLRNFECFMDAAYTYAEERDLDAARQVLVQLVTDAFEQKEQQVAWLQAIESRPVWKQECEQLCAEHDGFLSSHEPPVIGVFGPKGTVGEMILAQVPGRACLKGVLPGLYTLKLLNTGLVLWQGQLRAQDLIWRVSSGTRVLEAAAQTGASRGRPTSRHILGQDEKMVLRTFAGLESGTIEIELKR